MQSDGIPNIMHYTPTKIISVVVTSCLLFNFKYFQILLDFILHSTTSRVQDKSIKALCKSAMVTMMIEYF